MLGMNKHNCKRAASIGVRDVQQNQCISNCLLSLQDQTSEKTQMERHICRVTDIVTSGSYSRKIIITYSKPIDNLLQFLTYHLVSDLLQFPS